MDESLLLNSCNCESTILLINLKLKLMFIKYTFYLTIITTISVIALFLFPREPKLKSTEYLMEVYDDGYYIYCDQGFVGVVPLGNTALDSLMVDYNE